MVWFHDSWSCPLGGADWICHLFQNVLNLEFSHKDKITKITKENNNATYASSKTSFLQYKWPCLNCCTYWEMYCSQDLFISKILDIELLKINVIFPMRQKTEKKKKLKMTYFILDHFYYSISNVYGKKKK